MEEKRLILAMMLTVVLFGGGLFFAGIAIRFKTQKYGFDGLAISYACLFLISGLILVPYAFYDARREGLIRACWAQGTAYAECISKYENHP